MVRPADTRSSRSHAPLTIVRDRKEAVALWMLEQLPEVTDLPGGYFSIGVERDGELIGGCLYSEYRPCPGGGNCVMWACGKRGWISRRVIAAMFAHPFVTLNCHRVTTLIRRGNKPSRKLVEDLGFVLEGKIRRGYNTREDQLIYGILRDEFTWM